jgi:protein ImuA
MSPPDPSELALLRRAVARIEGRGAEAFANPGAASDSRFSTRKAAVGRLPLGVRPLDGLLGGGLKAGALYETVPGSPGDESAAAAFSLSLALRFARVRPGAVVWVIEDFARAETGTPYGPGLQEWGLDPGRLVLVRAAEAKTALWALEEALKCRSCAAVVGELWSSARRWGEVAARRLSLAAGRGGAPCILLHAAAFGGAVSSQGGQARFVVFAAPAPPDGRGRAVGLGSAGLGSGSLGSGSLDLPGAPRFAVQVQRARLDGATLFDPETRRLVGWSPAAGLFHEPRQEVRGDSPIFAERA